MFVPGKSGRASQGSRKDFNSEIFLSGGGNEASLPYGGKELEICFLYKGKGQQLVKAEFKELPHLSTSP